MHFQLPPHDHTKVVALSEGRALDVLVDLRAGPDFGKVCSIDLSLYDVGTVLVIARGVGHGFLAKSDDCRMNYLVSSRYAPEHDRGVLWNSINFEWPVSKPILSERDKTHPTIQGMDPLIIV